MILTAHLRDGRLYRIDKTLQSEKVGSSKITVKFILDLPQLTINRR